MAEKQGLIGKTINETGDINTLDRASTLKENIEDLINENKDLKKEN